MTADVTESHIQHKSVYSTAVLDTSMYKYNECWSFLFSLYLHVE